MAEVFREMMAPKAVDEPMLMRERRMEITLERMRALTGMWSVGWI